MPIYKTILILPDEASVFPFQEAVEDYALGTAAFEWEGGPSWSLEFYTEGMPPMVDLGDGHRVACPYHDEPSVLDAARQVAS